MMWMTRQQACCIHPPMSHKSSRHGSIAVMHNVQRPVQHTQGPATITLRLVIGAARELLGQNGQLWEKAIGAQKRLRLREQEVRKLPLGSGHQHSCLPRPRHGLTGQPGKPRALPSPLRAAPTHGHQLPLHHQVLRWTNLRARIW